MNQEFKGNAFSSKVMPFDCKLKFHFVHFDSFGAVVRVLFRQCACYRPAINLNAQQLIKMHALQI